MSLNFLALAKPITQEVVAGRLSVKEAKRRLRYNADVVVRQAVTFRLLLWSRRCRRDNIALEPGEERVFR